MADYPHARTPLDRALWVVQHHRTPELDVAELDRSGLIAVRAAIAERLVRARNRHLRSHLVGAGFTAVFLGLGLALMAVGPAAVLGFTERFGVYFHPDDEVLFWFFLVIMLGLGATAADYVLRRRLKLARANASTVKDLREAEAKVDAVMASFEQRQP